MGNLYVAGQDLTAGTLNQYYGFADTNATTVTAAATTQLTSSYTINANEPVAGSTYEMEFGGNGTWQTALIAFTVTIAGNTILNNNPGIAGGAFTAGAAFRFTGRAIWVCATTGPTGTFFADLTVNVTEIGTPNGLFTAATNTVSVCDSNTVGQPVNTTLAMPVYVTAGWGGTSGGPTITNRLTVFRKIS